MSRFRYRFEAALVEARARASGVRRTFAMACAAESRAARTLADARAESSSAPSQGDRIEIAALLDRDAWGRACATRLAARTAEFEDARDRARRARLAFERERRRVDAIERHRERRRREHDACEARRDEAELDEANALAAGRTRGRT